MLAYFWSARINRQSQRTSVPCPPDFFAYTKCGGIEPSHEAAAALTLATCLAQSFPAARTTNPGVFNSFAALLHSSSSRLGCKYVIFALLQSMLSVVTASDEWSSQMRIESSLIFYLNNLSILAFLCSGFTRDQSVCKISKCL